MARTFILLTLVYTSILVNVHAGSLADLGYSPEEAMIRPISQVFMGSNSTCLMPALAGLGRRQVTSCNDPGYVPCSNANFCCPPGQICQPNNPRGGVNGWCCPSFGLQCNGRACCDGSKGFCCGSTCCVNGQTCSKGVCLSSPTLSPTSPTIVSTTTLNVPSTSATTSVPTPITSANKPQDTRMPVGTINLDYNRLVYGSRQLSTSKQSDRQQAISKLFEAICKGIGSASSVVLSFTNDPHTQQSNRNSSGCSSNPCASNPSGSACLQFPFASTTDASSGSSWTCVPPLTQYIQGAILSSFRNHTSISTGSAFALALTNYNCQTLSPAPLMNGLVIVNPEIGAAGHVKSQVARRDLTPGGSDDQMESFPPFTDQDNLSTVISGLGDMSAGTYTITTKVSEGTVSDLRVVDSDGNQLGSASGSALANGQRSFTFTLPANAMGAGYLMSTSDAAVNIASSMQTGGGSNGASSIRVQPWATSLLSAATVVFAIHQLL